MYKQTALDLSVKGSNLCRFLSDEKKEGLISQKLFDSVCELAQCCYAMDNPSLAKTDIASFRKTASITYSNIQLYLETLYITGYISAAQKDSMTNTLDTLRKEMNI